MSLTLLLLVVLTTITLLLLKVLNNWLLKGSANDEHQAIDPLGILNPTCSVIKSGKLRSLNLDLRPDLFRRQGLTGPKSAPVIQVEIIHPVCSGATRSEGFSASLQQESTFVFITFIT